MTRSVRGAPARAGHQQWHYPDHYPACAADGEHPQAVRVIGSALHTSGVEERHTTCRQVINAAHHDQPSLLQQFRDDG